jgi:hypothetical protein
MLAKLISPVIAFSNHPFARPFVRILPEGVRQALEALDATARMNKETPGPSESSVPRRPNALWRPVIVMPASPEAIKGMTAKALDHLATSYVVQETPQGERIGRWGEGLNSHWDTGFSLITELVLRTDDVDGILGMARYILSRQCPDGGWKDNPGDDESGVTCTVINYAALARLYDSGFLSGNDALREQVGMALRASRHFLTGEEGVSAYPAGPLPISILFKPNVIARTYYAVAFPESLPYLPPIDFSWLLPSPAVAGWCVDKAGLYDIARHFGFAMPLLLSQGFNADAPKIRAYREALLKAQGRSGLWCYVPVVTNLALIALKNCDDGSPETREALERGLAAVRRHRQLGAEGIRTYTFDSYTWNNVMVMRARLNADRKAIADEDVLAGIRYLLACQEEDGQFQYTYGADGEAENDTTGFIVSFLVEARNLLESQPDVLSAEARDELIDRLRDAVVRGAECLVREQNENGGFAAFSKTDADKAPGPQKIPLPMRFMGAASRFNMFDESVADITAHALQAMGDAGLKAGHSPVASRAVRWLRKDFVPGAGWWGRWGGGYVYGTSAVLAAFKAAGIDMKFDHQVHEAVQIFKNRQNPDGGWGERGRFSDDPDLNPFVHAMRGPSHPVLTALAVTALLDAGVGADDPMVVAGVNFILTRFKDPTEVTRLIRAGRQAEIPFAVQDDAIWDSPNGFAGFMPPIWYADELTFGDALPLLALQRYEAERGVRY